MVSKHRLMAKAIQLSVPLLNIFRRPEPWPYTLEELGEFEDATLGRELYQFLSGRGLGYLPKYEEHDAYHTLLGYGTTVTEELKLQAFMWGNGHSTLAGRVLFVLGLSIFPAKRKVLKSELRRGRKASPLAARPIAEMLSWPVQDLRSDFQIY